MSDEKDIRPIRIDWRIPLPVIIAIAIQSCMFIAWASSEKTEITQRVSSLEKWTNQNAQVIERVARIEERIDGLKAQGNRIENKLDDAVFTKGKNR